MKTAVIQFNAKDNKSQNVEKAELFVKEAIRKKAEFILLPEVFIYRGRKQPYQVSENIPGEGTRPLMALAKKHNVFILAGSIYEKCGSTQAHNTSVMINSRGEIAAKYRKIHLFDAVIGKKKIQESKRFVAGRKSVTTKVKGFHLGMSICYDLRFADLYQKYAASGADVLCIPSAFTKKTGEMHWEVLLRARAIENLCYVLAPNQIGMHERGVVSYGHSMIIDPWGKILARASGDKEEIIYAHLDKNIIKQKRKLLPAIQS